MPQANLQDLTPHKALGIHDGVKCDAPGRYVGLGPAAWPRPRKRRRFSTRSRVLIWLKAHEKVPPASGGAWPMAKSSCVGERVLGWEPRMLLEDGLRETGARFEHSLESPVVLLTNVSDNTSDQ